MTGRPSSPPRWPMSALFPEQFRWKFATGNRTVKEYLLDTSGCNEVEHDGSAHGQDNLQNSPNCPFLPSDSPGEPAVHFLVCKGHQLGGQSSLDISKEFMDKIGDDWKIPRNLIDRFHVWRGAISMNHLIEYELSMENESVSSAELRSPRFLNVALADLLFESNGYVMILRHDIVTQKTACFFISFSHSEGYDPMKIFQEKYDDILRNPLTMFWTILDKQIISALGLARKHLNRGTLLELRAKLGVTPDDSWLAEWFHRPGKENYQSLTADLYLFSERILTQEEYCMSNAKNLRSLQEVNYTLYNLRLRAAGAAESCHNDKWDAYYQLEERLKALAREMESQTIELRSSSAILQCQFQVLYNMISQRDNQVSIMMAESSKDIAQATRRDGMYMKTIAIVTLVFLPATFVSAVFSTTVFSSQGSNSNLWWIYTLLCLTLTLTTLSVWFGFMKNWSKKEAMRNNFEMRGKQRMEKHQQAPESTRMANFAGLSGRSSLSFPSRGPPFG